MSDPGGDRVYYPVPLTAIGAAYQAMADHFIADKVFPLLPGGRKPGPPAPPAPKRRQPATVRLSALSVDVPRPLDLARVSAIVADLRAGVRLPPLEVTDVSFVDSEGWNEPREAYEITDGQHRFAAALIAGAAELDVLVKWWP